MNDCAVCGYPAWSAISDQWLCIPHLDDLRNWTNDAQLWRIKIMKADYQKTRWYEFHGANNFVCPFCGDFSAPIDSEEADEHRKECKRPPVVPQREFTFAD